MTVDDIQRRMLQWQMVTILLMIVRHGLVCVVEDLVGQIKGMIYYSHLMSAPASTTRQWLNHNPSSWR